jgi:uncharacterized protein YhaN
MWLPDCFSDRFTLIFAENRQGKTTLSSILRSPLQNVPAMPTSGRTVIHLGEA